MSTVTITHDLSKARELKLGDVIAVVCSENGQFYPAYLNTHANLLDYSEVVGLRKIGRMRQNVHYYEITTELGVFILHPQNHVLIHKF